MIQQSVYKDFDFQILKSEEFKEDAVREELINPILKHLGYRSFGHNRIIYSKSLSHPFVNIGSKKRKINIVPDYLFEINGKNSWILDAKAPNENITSGENVEQAYSYAIHPDIKADIFALCNGKEFAAFSIDHAEPILFFQLSEIDKHWENIQGFLSPDKFVEKQILNTYEDNTVKENDFHYSNLKLPKPILPKKQAVKRHFGVHGYFTRQSWDILQHYIKHFTQPNDTVLDPFGGTGVTTIEALILDRKAIHIDLNPLSPFMVNSLIAPVKMDELHLEFEKIKKKFEKNCPKTDEEINEAKIKYKYPNVRVGMRGADVETVEDLFTDKQIAQLAYLKHLIMRVKDLNIQQSLLLAFSSTITKINRTYHPSSSRGDNAGDCAAFRYYRYRLAKKEVDLDVMDSFSHKFKRLVNAKKEIAPLINESTINNAKIIKGTATDLSMISSQTIDYIYTDPPYGDKIPYLDLSIMWNAWLDLDVSEQDRKEEAIEGGRLEKTKDEYSNLLADSIKEMYRVLKYDRWMSFVFAHKDPHYWHIIVDAAEKCGFEYAGAVKQNNGQSSFKKRQNPFSVLSGQLIINFIKKETPKAIQKFKLGNDIYDLIIETIESVIAKYEGADLEQINDELIIKGLEFGFLDVLSREYKDLTPILMYEFDYNLQTKKFHIKENQKFKTKIPLDMRIKYFLISYMKRKEFNKEFPTTDDIILDIMPLLRNGITPENQTILKILDIIADEFEKNKWRLKRGGQLSLDLF
ncbi:MAG TPA: DNA methyltransferase [Edaphocola sp.]|nr:DNA methyltransferase [Edaphocola sp.]